MGRRKRIFVLICLALVAVAIGVGLWHRSRSQRAALSPEDQFTAVPVRRMALSTEINATGKVTSESSVDVYAHKSGIVDKVLVSEGDEVRAGDVLIELAVSEIDVQQAEATVRQRQQSLSLAEEALEKIRKLYDKGAATAFELRNAESDLATARDNLENAVLKLNELLTSADDNTIRAPVGGVVSSINVAVGSTVGTSSRVATIVDLDRLVLEVTVDEYDVGKVKVGQKAEILVEALAGTAFEGTVTHVGKIGETSGGVVVFPVKIAIDNPTADLRPGMSAEAEVIVQRADNALAVPNAALEAGRGSYVARVLGADGKIEYKPVEIGMRTNTMTEIVSGLSEGDRVAVPVGEASGSFETRFPGAGFWPGAGGVMMGGRTVIIGTGRQGAPR